MKTLWEKEKLLITSNFSFSYSVFYLFGEVSSIFIKFEIVVCELCQFGRVYFLFRKKVTSSAKTLNMTFYAMSDYVRHSLAVSIQLMSYIFTFFRIVLFLVEDKNFPLKSSMICRLQLLSNWISIKNFRLVTGSEFFILLSAIHLNLSPNKSWFFRVCSTNLLKTVCAKEKLLIMSNFSFPHNVFYLFGELFAIFFKFEIVVCSVVRFGRVRILLLGKG